MARYSLRLSCGFLMLAAGVLRGDDVPLFQAPPDAFAFDDTATFEGYQPGLLRIRDSKMEVWLLQVRPDTRVKVEAEVERDYLRSGLLVQFEAEIDDDFALAEPIAEIKLISDREKPVLGLYSAEEGADDSRPVRTPSAGTYLIKGKIAMLKDDTLTLAAGRRKITGELDSELKILFTSDDPGIAQIGDEVKVKAWYYQTTKPMPDKSQPGKAIAEDVAIKLFKPLAAEGNKRTRRAERPTKATAKSDKDDE